MTNPNPVPPKTDTPATPQGMRKIACKHHLDPNFCAPCSVPSPYDSMTREQLVDALLVASHEGWQLAHESRSCGHPRAFYRDKNFPASEDSYNPETGMSDPPMVYRCELCELESTLAAERASRLQAEEALRELDALWDFSDPITPMTAITYDDPSAINAAMAKARAFLSKPSVSHEQAEEKK